MFKTGNIAFDAAYAQLVADIARLSEEKAQAVANAVEAQAQLVAFQSKPQTEWHTLDN